MAFVSDGPGSSMETLFVSDNGGPGGQGSWGKGLARIDLTTMKLIPIGGYTWPNAGFNAELTGTGDGNLYGFFTTTPAGVAEIDTSTGATQGTVTLADVNNVNGGYAVAFWGGDLWFFTAYPTAQDPGATTSITRYDRLADQTVVVMKNIGRTIVGAGVSTSAPTSYPH
jgi:enamine deaminase RidA (YjgF/YER057c/UK114 family)